VEQVVTEFDVENVAGLRLGRRVEDGLVCRANDGKSTFEGAVWMVSVDCGLEVQEGLAALGKSGLRQPLHFRGSPGEFLSV